MKIGKPVDASKWGSRGRGGGRAPSALTLAIKELKPGQGRIIRDATVGDRQNAATIGLREHGKGNFHSSYDSETKELRVWRD